MPTLFTRIINRDIPARIVAETDDYIAFMDIRPLAEGHLLCVPKREVDRYFDLTEEELAGLSVFSKRVAAALEATVNCNRVAVLVLGLEVPHAHLHLIPIQTELDFWGGKSVAVSEERMEEIAEGVRRIFAG